MTEVDPSRSSENGNTKHSRKKQISPAKGWCFTFNNYSSEDPKIIHDVLIKECKKFIFQKEIGEQGTPHLQGFAEFNKKIRPDSLKLNKTIHWEKCRNKEASIEYCKKSETATGEIYTNIKFKKEIKTLDENMLRNWEIDIINIINKEPDDRKIYWYWENKGNSGKSTFVKYLCIKYGALLLSNKSSDMKYGIVKYMEKNDGCYPEIIIIDIPRSISSDFISYTGIEEIKNACFFSTKYESDMVIGNCPHLFIFANEEPNKDKLSLDRWAIVNIL